MGHVHLLLLSMSVTLALGRILDGLFLSPELLKTGVEVKDTNDYMDYDPDKVSRNVITVNILFVTNGVNAIIKIENNDAIYKEI